MIMSHGSPISCGVAILFKKRFDCTILSKFEDPLGSYLILKAEIKDKLNVLINIYAPNNDKDITNFLNYPRTILQNENLEDEENIIIARLDSADNLFSHDKKKVVQCYRGNQLLKPLIVYETNLIWLTFENLKSFFKKFHGEQKLANDFIPLRLLADFK